MFLPKLNEADLAACYACTVLQLEEDVVDDTGDVISSGSAEHQKRYVNFSYLIFTCEYNGVEKKIIGITTG